MTSIDPVTGSAIFAFLERLWPYCRSITGNGVRKTLADVRTILPELEVLEIPSGSKALDWVVPDEWNLKDAWVKAPDGRKVIDAQQNNIHLVGYSEPFEGRVGRDELLRHLHSLESQPDVIPYVTSYYKRRWGFCVPYATLNGFTEEAYDVCVDATLEPGSLSVGEWVLPGETDEEILFSTYVCHPSMANDQLSGIGLAAFLGGWLRSRPHRRFTYRILFLPEIIGSAAYLERNLTHLKARTIAAFNLTCVGDERGWSYLPSRTGGTLADKVVTHLLRHHTDEFTAFTWNDRGSDESMFCAPGIDLPMVSMMRSKYGTFPEYHTSDDRLGVTVTAKGLQQSFEMYIRLISGLERHHRPVARVLGEPQLGRRGLYPDLSIKGSSRPVKTLLNVLSYCDGIHDLYDISDRAGVPLDDVIATLNVLVNEGLVGDAVQNHSFV
jgi:aminopeptidase-like protein